MRSRLYACLLAFLIAVMISPYLRAYADADSASPCTALLEVRTGMLLAGDEPEKQVCAGSQTKLLTVYTAAEAVAAGRFAPETTVTVSPCAEGAPGATVWLRGGEKITLTDLMKAIIIGNASDACIAAACAVSGSEEAFVRDMNAAAFSLGMRSSRFTDCTGASAENITTAHDLARLSAALMQIAWLRPIFAVWRDFLRGGETELVSENRLLRDGIGICGMKAGHGEASGYTLAVTAEQDGLCFAAVILGGSDPDARFADAKRMLKQAFSSYYVTTPDFSTENLRPVHVRCGTEDAVMLRAGDLLAAAAPNGEQITCTVILPEYAEAPVRAGQQIGWAAFYCGDSLLYEFPLTADADVPRRRLRDSLRMLLGKMFK